MDNLYLITRLDDIRIVFTALAVLAGITAIIFLIVYISYKEELVGHTEEYINTYQQKEEYWCRFGKRWAIWSLVIFFICMIAHCVTPTTKQALLLFGVKETVEYCDKHPEVKQLPSKCIKALTLYIDKETQELEAKQ